MALTLSLHQPWYRYFLLVPPLVSVSYEYRVLRHLDGYGQVIFSYSLCEEIALLMLVSLDLFLQLRRGSCLFLSLIQWMLRKLTQQWSRILYQLSGSLLLNHNGFQYRSISQLTP